MRTELQRVYQYRILRVNNFVVAKLINTLTEHVHFVINRVYIFSIYIRNEYKIHMILCMDLVAMG